MLVPVKLKLMDTPFGCIILSTWTLSYQKTKCVFCWKEDKGIKHSVSDLYAMHLEDLLEIDKPPSPTQLPLDFITQLITLCHPDKHGNSQKATTATQKLLAMRDAASHATEDKF